MFLPIHHKVQTLAYTSLFLSFFLSFFLFSFDDEAETGRADVFNGSYKFCQQLSREN